MTIVDTTILRYAAGSDDPLRASCQQVMQWHLDRRLELATTVEVIQEFTHTYAGRRPRTAAVAQARRFAGMLPLLSVDPTDLDLGLTIFESNSRLGGFDSVLAAVAINRRAEALISADRAFAEVAGLRWLDPRSPDVAQLG
jgi:predicted nucleic acid-binding protein